MADPGFSPPVANDELARRFFLPFVKKMFPRYQVNDVAKIVAWELEDFIGQVERGESPRLIIELPPRVGKSELVSRKFPPFVLGNHPDWRLGLVSYGADLAKSLSRDARGCVMSEEYAELFASQDTEDIENEVELDRTAKAVHEWRLKPTKDNPQPGGLTATGLVGTLTGKGFQILIIDDPHKNWEDANSLAAKNRVWSFYAGTLYDRLEPGAGIVIVQQRWAVDDLVGRLTAEQDGIDEEGFDVEHLDRWKVIRMPAQAEAGVEDALGRQPGEWLPARYTPAQWERAKANNLRRDPRIWYAKFQQNPTPPDGLFFHPQGDVRFEDDEEFAEGPVFMIGDTSYGQKRTSDWSCFGVWRYEKRHRRGMRVGGPFDVEETYRLLHVYRKRAPFPTLKIDLIDLAAQYGIFLSDPDMPWTGLRPRIYVEDYGSGTSLLQEFALPVLHPKFGRIRLPVQSWRPRRAESKDSRAHAVTPYFREGKVAMPKSAPWLAHLLTTMATFQGEGSVEYDDEIDMLSSSLTLLGVQQPAAHSVPREMPFRIVA